MNRFDIHIHMLMYFTNNSCSWALNWVKTSASRENIETDQRCQNHMSKQLFNSDLHNVNKHKLFS